MKITPCAPPHPTPTPSTPALISSASSPTSSHRYTSYLDEATGAHRAGSPSVRSPFDRALRSPEQAPARTLCSPSTHGAAPSQVVVPAGTAYADLIGRAFVVHDFDGARISCDVLRPLSEDC